jgi:hypothetical protein
LLERLLALVLQQQDEPVALVAGEGWAGSPGSVMAS